MGLDTCEKLIVENTVFTHVENPGELVLSSGYDAKRGGGRESMADSSFPARLHFMLHQAGKDALGWSAF